MRKTKLFIAAMAVFLLAGCSSEVITVTGTISEEDLQKLDPLLPVSVIGRVTEKGTGIVYLTDRDGKKRLFAKGYDHFGDS